eukprot:14536410-Ditylum_brightwellii.AAC.1
MIDDQTHHSTINEVGVNDLKTSGENNDKDDFYNSEAVFCLPTQADSSSSSMSSESDGEMENEILTSDIHSDFNGESCKGKSESFGFDFLNTANNFSSINEERDNDTKVHDTTDGAVPPIILHNIDSKNTISALRLNTGFDHDNDSVYLDAGEEEIEMVCLRLPTQESSSSEDEIESSDDDDENITNSIANDFETKS